MRMSVSFNFFDDYGQSYLPMIWFTLVVHKARCGSSERPAKVEGVECGVFVLHFMRCHSDRLDVHSQVEKLSQFRWIFSFILHSIEIRLL